MADAIRKRNIFCSDSSKMATNSIGNKSLVERNKILFFLEIFTDTAFVISLSQNSLKATVAAWKAFPLRCWYFLSAHSFEMRGYICPFSIFELLFFRRIETGDREQRSIHLTQIEWNQFCSAKSFCSVGIVRDTYRNTPIFFQLFVFNSPHVKQYQTISTNVWLISCCSTFAYWFE